MHCPGRCSWTCSPFFSTVIPLMKHSTEHMAPSLITRLWDPESSAEKKTPSTKAGSVKTSEKRSKASSSNKHMNYSNCQELWLHDITSSSLLLLKSKPGHPMGRWAAPHNLLWSTIWALMDAHRLPQSKSFHLQETHELYKQLDLLECVERSEEFWNFRQCFVRSGMWRLSIFLLQGI